MELVKRGGIYRLSPAVAADTNAGVAPVDAESLERANDTTGIAPCMNR